MRDNNMNSEKDQVSEIQTSTELLKELVIEYGEQLFSLEYTLKEKSNSLKIKEQELQELERTNDYNIDLFSPIYNVTSNVSIVQDGIKNIQNEISEINKKIEFLTNRIEGLRETIKLINSFNQQQNNESKSRLDYKIEEIGLNILEAQEFERQRIARDLHDTTVQNLTGMVHKAELCVKLIDIDTIRAKLELLTMSSTLKSTISDMRGIIYNLKPMSLDDLGLTITVERYAQSLMEQSNIKINIHSNEEKYDIHPVIKLTLFRVIQEACSNVKKHAKASHINIDIEYQENHILIKIVDDGIGFNMNKLASNSIIQCSKFGLTFMKERIALLSGNIEILSEEEKGTNITINVPLKALGGEKDE